MFELSHIFSGKKTYIALAVGVFVVLINKFLGIEIPGVVLNPQDWLSYIWMFATGTALRAGIAKK